MIYSVIVIGGGPCGLAASYKASENEGEVLLVEREARLGGILKQCVHDGFGLLRFSEKLSGPEYSGRYIDFVKSKKNITVKTLAFVTKIEKKDGIFIVNLVTRNGIERVEGKSIVLATGCRERTSKQVFIGGTRPSGVLTAGTAQYFVNILGQMPTKRCVILGSGDIGLIMARRLTLEGAKVLGVYEVKPTPSGLNRNIAQCLNDFNIPLYLSKTVVRVFGEDRLEAVEVASVDEKMNVIPNTSERIECDGLILSVGLIPENELAESLGCKLDNATKGPVCDQNFMTTKEGVFIAGNALHVNDLVDYVSECGELAGDSASKYVEKERVTVNVVKENGLLYVVPQLIDLRSSLKEVVFYFRGSSIMKKATLNVYADDKLCFSKKYPRLAPPEMEKLVLNMSDYGLNSSSVVKFTVSKEEK